MFEKYLTLVESFRGYQLSVWLKKTRCNIIAKLNGPNFSRRFTHYFQTINQEGVPFTDYEQNPDTISQIKKIINALYHAQNTFYDLENVDIRNYKRTLSDLESLYSKTIHEAYLACQLITHLDIDLLGIFTEEFTTIISVLKKIQDLVASNSSEKKPNPPEKEQITDALLKKQQKNPIHTLTNNFGLGSGILINQLQPYGGDLDYAFLTQFSALLPGYIQQYTNLIRKYSADMVTNEPKLNRAKIEELKLAAISLLSNLEDLNGNDFVVSLKYLNYIHIVRHVITLSMTILDQVGEFSVSSQDAIRAQLKDIKKGISLLLGFADKIEDYGMLKPGIISQPMMEQIKPIYTFLIYYASKIVDFNAKGEELLVIEDSSFIALRTEHSYERIDKASKESFKIQRASDALDEFYRLLNTKTPEQQYLNQLPQTLQAELIEQYKIIKPYFEKIDMDLNNAIIDNLLPSDNELESWSSLFWSIDPLTIVTRLISCGHTTVHINQIKQIEPKIKALIEKNKTSQQFHSALNEDLINSIYEQSALQLFPCNQEKNVFTIDESKALNIPEENVLLIDESETISTEQIEQQTLSFECIEYNKFIKQDTQKNLTSDQCFNLFGWYRQKQLQFVTAQEAYNTFMSLISSNLEQINDTNKEQCSDLYGVFQPYFIRIIAQKNQQAAFRCDKYLTHLLFGETFTIEAPEPQLFTLLNDYFKIHFEAVLSQLESKKTNYLALAKNRLATELVGKQTTSYIDNRATTITNQILATPAPKKLTFKKQNGNTWLLNPEDLTSEQALDLKQAYKNKQNKSRDASTAYHKFMELVGSNLNNINDNNKDEVRNLYNVFQYYFIHGVPETHKDAAIQCDKYLVQTFSGKEVTATAPPANFFAELDEHFQKYFSEIEKQWSADGKKYLQWAKTLYKQEYKQSILKKSKDNTNYSKAIKEYRHSLESIILRLNLSMQSELTIKIADALPFPELEDKDAVLAEPKQVIAIKSLYNYLFHIEKIVVELEQLSDKSYEYEYVLHLIYAYSNIYEIIQLNKRLVNDPLLSLIGRDIVDKFFALITSIQEHTDAYQISPPRLTTGDRPIQYNPLWLILNAFYVSPKHIRSLGNNNLINAEQLDALHLQAKKSTLIVEKLIISSDSYFKLFTQTINMYKLYESMKAKFYDFTSTTHDAVMNNLKAFQSDVFLPLLQEADLWEERLGLKPGSISNQLETIIDEYFKGFLFPLGLHSKTHIDLFCDPGPLETRIQLTQNKIKQAKISVKNRVAEYQFLEQFYELLTNKENEETINTIDEALWPQALKQQLEDAYKACLPRLVMLQENVAAQQSTLNSDKQLDLFLNQKTQSDDPEIINIRALTIAGYNYYAGLQRTDLLSLETAKEKEADLKKIQEGQPIKRQEFTEDYTRIAFERELTAICNSQVGLLNTDKEYNQELNNYLLRFKENIIARSKIAEDINLAIKRGLQYHTSTFEKSHFAKYYHLDRIRTALAQFKPYINRCRSEEDGDLFEDDATLTAKSILINKVDDLAANTGLSIEDRISQITTMVEAPSFEKTLLAEKKSNGWTYLSQCFYKLLTALYLYTPTRKKLHDRIHSVVTTTPEIDELIQRYSLFSAKKIELNQPNITINLPDPKI